MTCPRVVFSTAIMVFAAAGQCWAECSDGSADQPMIASNQHEYARGQPKRLLLDTGDRTVTMDYIKVGDLAVVEGDIVLGNAQQLEFQAASGPVRIAPPPGAQPTDTSGLHPFANALRSVVGGPLKWTDGVIPYQIDPALPQEQQDNIARAIKAWSDATPIRFAPLDQQVHKKYPNDVYFTLGTDPNACLSDYVGMHGGRQFVRLVKGCAYGEILHEIGHVIALEHEQNRSDRNKYVSVVTKNIMKGYEGQFRQYLTDYMDIGAYDYDSVMHYQATAFSCNNAATLVATQQLPTGIIIGQRDHLSKGDINAVAAIYKKK